jgi:peptidyl-prolyl cis-trans isomerase D
MDPRLAQAAFATAEGAVSAPVQGPFGWVILRPVRVTPGVSKSFEEVREELRQTLIRARGQIHIQELVDALEDARAGGAALADAARNLNLMVRSVPAVDARGMTPAGARAEIPENPAFLQQVFGLEAGDESDPFRTDDDHSYVVKINGVTPTALKPLAEVRDAVREAWTADARAEAVRKRADEIAERARTAGLAAAAGRAPMVVNGLRRDQPSDVLSAALLQEFFGQPVGGVVHGPAMTAPNYVVARAASIQHPPLDPASPAYTQFRGQMANELSLDLVQTLANAARAEVDVETHPDVIQAALGQAPQ